MVSSWGLLRMVLATLSVNAIISDKAKALRVSFVAVKFVLSIALIEIAISNKTTITSISEWPKHLVFIISSPISVEQSLINKQEKIRRKSMRTKIL